MANRLLLEAGTTDGFLLESGSGVILMEGAAADALLADDLVTGLPALGTPAVGQKHVLLANDLSTPAPTFGTIGVKQKHVLTVVSLTTPQPTFGVPAGGQIHVLLASGLSVLAPILSNPTLGGGGITLPDALLADSLAVGFPVFSSPNLSINSVPVTPVSVDGGGFSRRRSIPVLVEYRGKQYVLSQEQLPAFLEATKEKEQARPVKKIRRKGKATKVVVDTRQPLITIKSAPTEYRQQIQASIDMTNDILKKIWEGMKVRAAMDQDDEEAILLLMGI